MPPVPGPVPFRTWRGATEQLGRGLVAPHRARQMLAAATEVGQTPSEVIREENRLELHRYEPVSEVDSQVDTPIVVVPAIINRPYILDLQPDRSVIRQFLERGFDVYLVDWGDPSRLDAALGLADYAGRYLGNCVEAVSDRTDRSAVNLLGYCTGGTLATIYAALSPGRVNALGLLAPVLDFDTEGGIFRFWGREEYYDPERLAETVGTVPGEWLAGEFSLVAPVEYYLARYVRLLEGLDDEAFATRFARRLRWGFDTVDVPGRLYRQFLVDLYRENELMAGELSVNGEAVDIETLTMPVLDVIGTDDRFIPADASRPFLDAIPSGDTEILEVPTDHVGLSISERAHAECWPEACAWFAARS